MTEKHNATIAKDGALVKLPPKKDMHGGAPVKTPLPPKPSSKPDKK